MHIDVYVHAGQNMFIKHEPTEVAGYNCPLWWKFSKYNLRHVKTSFRKFLFCIPSNRSGCSGRGYRSCSAEVFGFRTSEIILFIAKKHV